jgi:hypothetical protein
MVLGLNNHRSLKILSAFYCFIQVSSLFAQTECELLRRPALSGVPTFDATDVYRVISCLSPRLVPEMAFLTEEQQIKINAIRRKFSSLDEDTPEPEDDSAAHIAAVNRGYEQKNQAALAVLAEFEQVLGELWPTVVFDANRRLAIGYGDPSGLSLSTVVDGLKLTVEQTTQIEKLKSKVEAEQKKLKLELADKLQILLVEHFSAIKTELDSVQQSRFLQWFGDLNLFKSLAFSDHYRNLILQIQNETNGGDTIKERTRFQKDGKPIKPVAERKDFEIDSLLYRVLTMHGINETLTLSPDQVERIDDQIHGNDIRLILRNRRAKRMQTILEDKWELPEWLDKILLPHQRTWMMQFEFQVYNLPYADSFGLLRPEVAESLKLTEQTRKRILDLAQNYRTKVTDMSRKTESAIALAEKEKQTAMMKVLTPEQTHQYRLWFGKVSDP